MFSVLSIEGVEGRVSVEKRRAIYRADTWHVDDGVATDGTDRPPVKNPVPLALVARALNPAGQLTDRAPSGARLGDAVVLYAERPTSGRVLSPYLGSRPRF